MAKDTIWSENANETEFPILPEQDFIIYGRGKEVGRKRSLEAAREVVKFGQILSYKVDVPEEVRLQVSANLARARNK